MAITLDANLGGTAGSIASSVSLTTTAAAAAGSRVVVIASWFNSTNGMTCTIGGTSATKDKQLDNTNDHLAIFSLVVAGGLASSSTITCNQDGGPGGLLIGAVSYLGTTSVDTTASNTGTTAAAWNSGSASNSIADALYVCGAGTDGSMTSESSTPNVGNERQDLFNATANQGAVMQDLIVSSIASRSLSGTWGTTTGLTTQTMALVIYKGTAASTARQFVPSRMPLGA